jgi:hypothetical protein
MKMIFFGKENLGEPWDCPTLPAAPPMCCFRCDEWIAKPDWGVIQLLVSADGPACIAYHYECHARMILGSLGHLKGRCYCFGGTEEDPPEMTAREAAKAALSYAQAGHKFNFPDPK